jgi:hypothetical protein
MSLQNKFDQLEDLLLNHRESIGLHNGVPFLMVIYNPEKELECRKYIQNIKEKLESRSLQVLNIPINLMIFNNLEKEGHLEDIFSYDEDQPLEVRKELSQRCKLALKHFILDKVKEKPSDIVFLTNVAGLYPYYRISNLLTSLEKEISIPFVVFYPGEIKDDKLYFMGELESNEYYRAQRI